MLIQAAELCVTFIARYNRITNRCIFDNLEVRINIIIFFLCGSAGCAAVHLLKKIIPPRLIVSLRMGEIPNRKFAFIKLEIRPFKFLANIIFINLVQIHVDTVNFNAGIVCLNIMFVCNR